jgi:xylulokinase
LEDEQRRSPVGESAYIGIDIGTSSCKGVLVTETGRVAASASRSYTPFRGTDGEVSQDARDWLGAMTEVLAEVARKAHALGLTVEAMAPTAPAHTAVLVDDAGEALDRVLLPYDTRSAATAAELERRYGRELFDRTFVRLGPSWTLPQLAWLRAQSPRYWSRIRHMLVTKDFATHSLTGGAVVTDPSDAAGTALYDQRAGKWIDSVCAAAGLSLDQLPEIRPAHDHAGALCADWAARSGLPSGIPVAVGCTDTAAELLSLDAQTPGRGLVKIASTGTVVVVIDKPRPDPRILTYPHCVPELWYTLTATNSAATAYQWLRETMFAAPSNDFVASYAEMDEVASKVSPGADGVLFLPFLTGERSPYWDADLRSAFLGVSAAHGRAHMSRAVLEGVALSLRDCRDLLRNLGVELTVPHYTGGGVASRLWRTILASILATTGTLCEPQGPAIGAALVAARSVGLEIALERSEESVPPEPDWLAPYDRLYLLYKNAVDQLAPLSHRLAHFGDA